MPKPQKPRQNQLGAALFNDKHWVRAKKVHTPDGDKVFYHCAMDWYPPGFWREHPDGIKDATLYSEHEKHDIEHRNPGVGVSWYWHKRY